MNYLLIGLFLLASLPFRSLEVSLGLLLGWAIVTINFKWLIRIAEQFMKKRKIATVKVLANVFLKFFFLIGSLVIVIFYTTLNVVAFLIGTTTIILAVLLAALFEMDREEIV
ncbi:MAG: ATP synthase subunit I [Candidatus Tectomicrobia bacterium]|nr:ATP synthase subunit I [Candidatus Tectomicrobia bacterium]